MSNVSIIKACDFDHLKLEISKKISLGSLNTHYMGKNLYVSTDIQRFNSGAQIEPTNALLKFMPSPQLRNLLMSLSTMLEKILEKKYSGSETGITVSELLNSDGLANFYLRVLSNGDLITTVFDNSMNRIDNPVNIISNKFCGKLLLSFRDIYISKNNKLTWRIEVIQLRVTETSKLPQGCFIIDTEEELLIKLKDRKTETIDSDDIGFEVTEEELGINELID